MATKVRLVAVHLQVEAMLDDGESLVPAQIAPLRLTPQQFKEFDLDEQRQFLQEAFDLKEE